MIKRIFKNSAIYSVKDVFEKAVYLLLIPVYTKYLTPEEFGTVSLMMMLASMITVFLGVGQPNALMRFYQDYQFEEQQEYLGSVMLYLLIIPFIICLLLFELGNTFFEVFFNQVIFYPYGFLAILIAYFACIPDLLLSLWRIQEKAKLYVLFALALFLSKEIISLFLIIQVALGAYGRLLGEAVVVGGGWLFVVIYFFNYIKRFTFSTTKLKKSLFFGLPLIPHILSAIILSVSDRYMLEHFTDLTQVGLYSLGYSIGSVALFVSTGFGQAWGPFFYSMADKQGAARLFSQIATYFFCLISVVSLALILFSKEIVGLLASSSYQDAYPVIPIVALGTFFNCLYNIPIYILYYYKKTSTIPYITVTAAIVNILLNLWIIPLYGMNGAAWATAISYLIMFVLVLIISDKLFHIPYEIGRMLMVIVTILAIYVVNSQFLGTTSSVSGTAGLLKIGSLIALFPIWYITGFWTKSERESMKRMLCKMYPICK
jgi:O-antigen/teichoic acid export membrane protein